MNDFVFHRPSTIADARAARAAALDGSYMTGGQSLLPVLKLDMAAPTDVISLRGVADLRGIRAEGDAVVIGAASTHAEVAADATVRERLPALARLAGEIGDPQVRNRGTLGGSLAHNDPAADYPAAVLALGATIKTDRREIAADDFFVAMFTTALEEGEIIVSVSFPTAAKAHYAKFPNPASRFAIVGVMVAETAQGVRVAVTGAAPSVYRWTEAEQALGGGLSPEALDSLAVDPETLNSDLDASAEYRAHLLKVIGRRAVAALA